LRRKEPVIGVVLLEADHSVETLELEDPFAWQAPAGLTPGFYGHPDFWPVPVLFAVAENATAAAAAAGDPDAMRGVADAVARLDGRCDLIVGNCGFFAEAWDFLPEAPSTPTVLSGFDLLDDALRSTSRDIAVFSFSEPPAERVLASHPERGRVRVIGLVPAGDWPLIGRLDWATDPQWTLAGLEEGLREVLETETRAGGRLDGIGGIVIECTVLPQFRGVIREYVSAPLYEAGAAAIAMLA
jgi:hypothetical protein